MMRTMMIWRIKIRKMRKIKIKMNLRVIKAKENK